MRHTENCRGGGMGGGGELSQCLDNPQAAYYNESISLSRSRGYMRGETGTVIYCIE